MNIDMKEIDNMNLYYDTELDILCIVEGDKIYKYIGDLATVEDLIIIHVRGCPIGVWYEAKNKPNMKDGWVKL